LLPNKAAIGPVDAILDTLSIYPPPFTIWTDSAPELKGDFDSVLRQRGIVHMLTGASNPQQNGKCERYYGTLEMAPSPAEVPDLIQEDNATPHFGLREVKRSR
jgi:transposase InsO family protein